MGTERQELPPLFRRHVRRPRLTRLLDETNARAIVLTAPAGYGKTTLAAEWLQGKPNVAWYRATAASRDFAAFAQGIAEACTRLTKDDYLKKHVAALDLATTSATHLAHRVVSHASLCGTTLVIDDYHLARQSSKADDFVESIIELSPLRLVVTTRTQPDWVSARRLLHGDVFELVRDQLAMREAEAGEVLREVPSHAAKALVRSAGGWPALVGLGALAAHASLPDASVGAALYRYLVEEVWRNQPPSAQKLMVQAAVLPDVDPEACGQILALGSVELLVENLRLSGLLHNYGGADHFHPLLRDLLLARLKEEPEVLTEVATNAVRYFRSAKRWDDAFEVAVRAGFSASAADIAGDAADDLLAAGRVETLEAWLAECGAAALRTKARLARAQVLIRRGRLHESREIARDVATESADQELACRAHWIMGQAAHLVSEHDQALEHHQHALAIAANPNDVARTAWGAFIAALELGREDTTDYLAAFAASAPDDIDTRLRVEVGNVLAAERQGSLEGVWARARPILEMARHAHDPMARVNALTVFACASNLRGDFTMARQLAQEAVRLARTFDLDFAVAFGLSARGEAETGMRQFKAAERTVHELSRLAAAHEDPHLQVDLETLRLKLSLSQGIIKDADLADDPFAQHSVPPDPYAEYLTLRAIMEAGAGAVRVSGETLARATLIARSARSVHLYQAGLIILESEGGQPRDFSLVLRQAHEAETLGTLIWAYRAAPSLLSFIRARCIAARAFVSVMTAAGDKDIALQHGLVSLLDVRNAEILTPREKEVYPLILEGLSNAAIAERLVISHNTAKVHVARVLNKFGKSSRLELILSARQRDEC